MTAEELDLRPAPSPAIDNMEQMQGGAETRSGARASACLLICCAGCVCECTAQSRMRGVAR
eukprot:3026194-Prymnesium_polylepis.1